MACNSCAYGVDLSPVAQEETIDEPLLDRCIALSDAGKVVYLVHGIEGNGQAVRCGGWETMPGKDWSDDKTVPIVFVRSPDEVPDVADVVAIDPSYEPGPDDTSWLERLGERVGHIVM